LNPVIDLDVAKGETKGQAFLDKGIPHGKHFNIIHTADGFERFHQILKDIEALGTVQPTVILESTGHYHIPVVQFLEERNYVYIIVNPLISHQAKKPSLRKVKTDAIDAYRLRELFYKEDFEPLKKRGLQLLNLRSLTRRCGATTGLYIQTKLQFHAVLDQVFPEYSGALATYFQRFPYEHCWRTDSSEAR